MKTIIPVLIALILFSFTYIYSTDKSSIYKYSISKISDSNKFDFAPCCNNLDPRSTTGSDWYIYCSGTEIPIDIICCVNVWNHYGGQPPENLNCTGIYLLCPETFD